MNKPSYFHLDPIKDNEAIVRQMVIDFWAYDIVRATEIALLKTFSIPSIAKILVDSGEFLQRTQKRYDDTDLLLSLFIENGHSSPTGRDAIRRINRMHARHPITNDQMLYTLATFVVEPILWIDAYGFRAFNALEREALFQFWIQVAALMGIKDIFRTLDEMLAFHERYEQQNMVYAEANARLYHGVLPTVVRMMPPGVGPIVAWLLPAIMLPRMCAAFGVKPRGAVTRALVKTVFRLRAWTARLLPKTPEFRTQLPRPTYPEGFAKEQLGV